MGLSFVEQLGRSSVLWHHLGKWWSRTLQLAISNRPMSWIASRKRSKSSQNFWRFKQNDEKVAILGGLNSRPNLPRALWELKKIVPPCGLILKQIQTTAWFSHDNRFWTPSLSVQRILCSLCNPNYRGIIGLHVNIARKARTVFTGHVVPSSFI